MKKSILFLVAAFMVTASASAQTDTRILNHLSVGVNLGTPGVGVDLAMPVTKYVDVEAGVSFIPKITYSTEIHPNLTQYMDAASVIKNLGLDEVPIQGKLKMVNGKVLINVYPFPSNGFHITAGAYFGKGEIVEVYNKEDGQLNAINVANQKIAEYNAIAQARGMELQQPIGLKLGDYLLEPDAAGNASAKLSTKGFKPYVGLGYGRAVPHKRVGFKVDLGAMFWGTPDVVDHNGTSLMKQDWEGKDGGAFRVISKFKVYPVLNFRICGRIF